MTARPEPGYPIGHCNVSCRGEAIFGPDRRPLVDRLIAQPTSRQRRSGARLLQNQVEELVVGIESRKPLVEQAACH